MYICPSSNDVTCYVPTEVKNLFAKACADGMIANREHYWQLHLYALAAVNLYGIISVDDFVALFNQQNRIKTNCTEVSEILIRYVSVDCGYTLWTNYIVNDEFIYQRFDDVSDLASLIQDKPRYVPSPKEFLRYADWRYYEQTFHVRKLYRFLLDILHISAAQAAETVRDIHHACVVEADMETIFNYLANHHDNEPSARFRTDYFCAA